MLAAYFASVNGCGGSGGIGEEVEGCLETRGVGELERRAEKDEYTRGGSALEAEGAMYGSKCASARTGEHRGRVLKPEAGGSEWTG